MCTRTSEKTRGPEDKCCEGGVCLNGQPAPAALAKVKGGLRQQGRANHTGFPGTVLLRRVEAVLP
jgi:hypothetical protein